MHTGLTHIIAIFVVILLPITLVVLYRYLYYPYIQGFDVTFHYIYHTRLASKSISTFIDMLLEWKRPLFLAIFVGLYLSGVSIYSLYFYYPFIISYLYVLSVYLLMRKSLGYKHALLISTVAPLNFFFIRISYDLYANFLALVIVNLLLTQYIRIKKSEKKSKRDQYVLIFFFIVLIFIHPWTGIIFLIIVSLNELFDFLSSNNKNFLCASAVLKAVLLMAILLGVAVNINLFIYFHLDFRFWQVKWSWMIAKESTIVLILSFIGFLYIIIHFDYEISKLIIAWVFTLSFLLYIPLEYYLVNAYRIYILYPLGILQGFGILAIVNTISSKLRFRCLPNFCKFKSLVYVSLILLIMVSILPNAIIHEYVYCPDSKTIDQIKEMNSIFGFENESVIYVIFNSPAKPLDPKSSPHVIGWVRAYLGDRVYEGHLIELLNQEPDIKGRVYNNLTDQLIVLGSRLYMLSNLELALCKEIEDGIFVLRPNDTILNITKSSLLSNYYAFYDFLVASDGWHIITSTLNVSIRNLGWSHNELRIKIMQNTIGWFTLEKSWADSFNTTDLQSLILHAYGNVTGINIMLEAYYASGKVKGKTMALHPGDIWLSIPIVQEDTLEKLRFAIFTDEATADMYMLTLDYLVLLAGNTTLLL